MSKVLVIGSKGFIGSCLVHYLKNNMHLEVFEADILADNNSPSYFRILNLESDIRHIFNNFKFSFCINCSGAASVPQSLVNPAKDFKSNVGVVVQLLESIRLFNPTCKLINLSSAAVYGNPIENPIAETTVTKPLSPYGFHKLIAEKLLEEYSLIFGLKTCSLRIFSAYGEGLRKQIFWDVYKLSKENPRVINFFGTGKETRDYIHVIDIVKCIATILFSDEVVFNASIINIGNGVQISLQEVVNKMLLTLNYKGEVHFTGQNREGDPLYWQADIGKIAQLGYIQSIGFDEGVKRYVEWVRNCE